MERAVAAFYDEFAERQLGDLLHPNPRLRAIRRRMGGVLTRRPLAALDIGCGIGIMTDWLAGFVPRVVGIDVSPRHIRIASALYDRPAFRVCQLPVQVPPDGPFDLVTLFDVLEHFDPDVRGDVFRRIGDVAADDAVVAVNLPSKLYSSELNEADKQIIDEAVGVDEVVALAASLSMEPLVVDRYGIDSPNQYVFCAFSRIYETRPPVAGSEIRHREKIEDVVASVRSRFRSRKQLARIREL